MAGGAKYDDCIFQRVPLHDDLKFEPADFSGRRGKILGPRRSRTRARGFAHSCARALASDARPSHPPPPPPAAHAAWHARIFALAPPHALGSEIPVCSRGLARWRPAEHGGRNAVGVCGPPHAGSLRPRSQGFAHRFIARGPWRGCYLAAAADIGARLYISPWQGVAPASAHPSASLRTLSRLRAPAAA